MVSPGYIKDKVNVFVSYSHSDSIVPLLFKFFTDDEPSINFWLDTSLKSATDWDKAIKNGIEKCDYFLLFLSPSIILSDYIMTTELEIAFNKNEKSSDDIIFPFILDFYSGYNSENHLNSFKYKLSVIKDDVKVNRSGLSSEKNSILTKTYKNNLNRLEKYITEKQVNSFVLDFPINEKKVKKYYKQIIEFIRSRITEDYRKLKSGLDLNRYLEFDKQSAIDIIELVKNTRGGIYLNTQINLIDWFHPALQLNLALQKEIEEVIDYKILIDKLKNNRLNSPIVTKTRICRVLVLPFKKDEIKKWKKSLEQDVRTEEHEINIKRYNNLIALNYIHEMMGSPMAVLGYDELFEILKEQNSNLLADDELEMLGLKPKNADFDRDELKILIEDQKVEVNKLKPSIDFACFDTKEDYQKFENYNNDKSIQDRINNVPAIKENTKIFKAIIEDDISETNNNHNNRKLRFFDFSENFEDDNGIKYLIIKHRKTKVELVHFDHLDLNDNKIYFKATQKFAWLIKEKVFEQKGTTDPSKELGKENSNALIYDLNYSSYLESKKEYKYLIAREEYNLKKIFNNG